MKLSKKILGVALVIMCLAFAGSAFAASTPVSVSSDTDLQKYLVTPGIDWVIIVDSFDITSTDVPSGKILGVAPGVKLNNSGDSTLATITVAAGGTLSDDSQAIEDDFGIFKGALKVIVQAEGSYIQEGTHYFGDDPNSNLLTITKGAVELISTDITIPDGTEVAVNPYANGDYANGGYLKLFTKVVIAEGATVEVDGQLLLATSSDAASITNSGMIENNGTLIIKEGAVISGDEGGISLDNKGTIENAGTIEYSYIENTGTILTVQPLVVSSGDVAIPAYIVTFDFTIEGDVANAEGVTIKATVGSDDIVSGDIVADGSEVSFLIEGAEPVDPDSQVTSYDWEVTQIIQGNPSITSADTNPLTVKPVGNLNAICTVTGTITDLEVTFSPEAGEVSVDESGAFELTITAGGYKDVSIYYTTDGSEPTTDARNPSSSDADNPAKFTIEFGDAEEVTVKALAYRVSPRLLSDVAEATYTKGSVTPPAITLLENKVELEIGGEPFDLKTLVDKIYIPDYPGAKPASIDWEIVDNTDKAVEQDPEDSAIITPAAKGSATVKGAIGDVSTDVITITVIEEGEVVVKLANPIELKVGDAYTISEFLNNPDFVTFTNATAADVTNFEPLIEDTTIADSVVEPGVETKFVALKEGETNLSVLVTISEEVYESNTVTLKVLPNPSLAPATEIQEILDAGTGSVTLYDDAGAVTLDYDALKAIFGDDSPVDLYLYIDPLAVEGAVTYEISFKTTYGVPISIDTVDKPIAVSVDYSGKLETGKTFQVTDVEGSDNVDAGTVLTSTPVEVDEDVWEIGFKTTHFSPYKVEIVNAEKGPGGGSSSSGCSAGAFGLIAFSLGAVVATRKK